MINLKTSKKVPTINVKVDPITNIHVADARASANVSVSNDGDKTNISEISACSNIATTEELDALKRENQVLKPIDERRDRFKDYNTTYSNATQSVA